jgi:hypothetical protein
MEWHCDHAAALQNRRSLIADLTTFLTNCGLGDEFYFFKPTFICWKESVITHSEPVFGNKILDSAFFFRVELETSQEIL